MFSHYFTTAIRNIRKNKLSFFINLIGLSLGLASAFIISGYVLKETSFDQFHSKNERIYRVLCDQTNVGWTSPGIPYVLKGNIDNSFPNVEKSCVVNHMYMAKVIQNEELFPYRGMYSSTPDFFDIFDCKLIYGNLDNALRQINSVVLTRSTSERFFPNENPIGKTLEVKFDSETYQLNVDAVIDDFPKNSSFRFKALLNSEISLQYYEAMSWALEFRTDWHLNFNKMFILLKNNNPEEFQAKWNQFETDHNLKEKEIHFHLQSLTNIHLNSSNIVNDNSTHGNISYIYLFSCIAFFILLVAAFNYIILSVSISKTRYKEIGVKKILGSPIAKIRNQFLAESIILSIIAFPIAYLLAFYSVGYLNQLFNISLTINIFKHIDQLFTFLFLLILIGLIAGSYIAFYLSQLNPLEIIKSKSGNLNKKIRLQYIMLLFQIIIFSGLTGASFSIYKQIDYLKNTDTGINLKNKLNITIDDLKLNTSSYQSLRKIVSDLPEVKSFTLGYCLPPQNSKSVSTAPDPKNETNMLKFESDYVTFDFFKFYKIQCLQGRLFNSEFKDDSSKIVLNESAVKLFGFIDPIGKIINEKEIIGVIKDFHTHSLHAPIDPTVYELVPVKYIFDIAMEYQEGFANVCSKKLEHELKQNFPNAQIEITPTELIIDNLYNADQNLNNIIIFFSLFAVIIALIGIFGQSLFAAKQQLKEIGIRKVNGATSKDIMLHVLKRYTLLCVIANVISWPIVYILINKWQENFIYKNPISIWLILFTLLVSIFVVLGTVLSNAWKASKTNPVDVLKYE